nr:hypothetical protein [uncultured Flavobacterium sp.]
MKSKKAELDVDFIGGQEPLTKDEEKAISEYLKGLKKSKSKTSSSSTSKTPSHQKRQYA